MAPSSSGQGCMVLSHEIEGSNPFGATNNEAEDYLCGGFPLFSYLEPNYHFTREPERESTRNTPPYVPHLRHSLRGGESRGVRAAIEKLSLKYGIPITRAV